MDTYDNIDFLFVTFKAAGRDQCFKLCSGGCRNVRQKDNMDGQRSLK